MAFLKKLPWFMIIFGGGGLLMLIPMMIGGFDAILHFGVAYGTRIVEGTPTWLMWKKIPIPVYLRVRVFNITNPKDVVNGAKPIVNEVGPYVYKESMEKVDINVNTEDDVIQYRQVRVYHFQPSMSKGKENDKVTFVNIAFVGMAKIAHDFTDADYLLSTLDEMLVAKGEKLMRTHTVRELLFDGFTVQSFLDLAKDPLIESAGDIKIPSQLLDGKMGILEGRNGSDDGTYQVRSGRHDSKDFGRVVTWNGFQTLTKWRGDPCNSVNGTDGILYQPFLERDTVLQAFVPDVCRSLTFRVEKQVYTSGIDCYRYRMDENILASVDKNPDNWCFCHSENLTHCSVDGIASIAACFEGAPLYLSNPHFLGGDPILHENVIGLEPDFEKHAGYFDLHPLSGVSIQVRQRMQFNIELTPWLAMPTFADTSYAIVPILWVEEGGDIDNFTRTMLKVLDIGLKIWAIGKWFQLIFLTLVLSGGIAILYQQKKATKVELLGPRPDDDDEDEEEEDDEEESEEYTPEKGGKEEPPPKYIPYD